MPYLRVEAEQEAGIGYKEQCHRLTELAQIERSKVKASRWDDRPVFETPDKRIVLKWRYKK